MVSGLAASALPGKSFKMQIPQPTSDIISQKLRGGAQKSVLMSPSGDSDVCSTLINTSFEHSGIVGQQFRNIFGSSCLPMTC